MSLVADHYMAMILEKFTELHVVVNVSHLVERKTIM